VERNFATGLGIYPQVEKKAVLTNKLKLNPKVVNFKWCVNTLFTDQLPLTLPYKA